jgi:hypothetical protein
MEQRTTKRIRKDHPSQVLVVEWRRRCRQCELDKVSIYSLDPAEEWREESWDKIVADAKKRQRKTIINVYLPEHSHPEKSNMILEYKQQWINKGENICL